MLSLNSAFKTYPCWTFTFCKWRK